MRRMTRRSFLRGTAIAAVGISTGRAGVFGANERFRVAVCGLHGQGEAHWDSYRKMKDVDLAYFVDPDEHVLRDAVKKLEERTKEKWNIACIKDVRKALEDKTLDAISVATPNHWHSLMVIWAAQAGKHCYVEKPGSHDVHQGRVAVEAWRKYGVVVQHGTQQRSDAGVAGLHDAIHAGKFGKLAISYGYACKKRGSIDRKPFSDPPPNLDWNLWRGPADIEKFHANYVHYNWHWFWETGNGELNNQGTHQLDRARWAIDKDMTHPVRAMALGGRFIWNDQGVTPNTLFGLAEYPNGQWVFFNVRNVDYKDYRQEVENQYYFEDGGKIIGERYYPKGISEGEKIKVPGGKVTPGGAWGSFVAAGRAKAPAMSNASMLEAHYSSVLGHLMNISYRLGEKVPFNAKAGRFGDNVAAYEHFMKLHAVMRDGCGVPEDKESYIVGPWLTFDPKTERFTGERAEQANALLRDPYRKGFEIPEIDKV